MISSTIPAENAFNKALTTFSEMFFKAKTEEEAQAAIDGLRKVRNGWIKIASLPKEFYGQTPRGLILARLERYGHPIASEAYQNHHRKVLAQNDWVDDFMATDNLREGVAILDTVQYRLHNKDDASVTDHEISAAMDKIISAETGIATNGFQGLPAIPALSYVYYKGRPIREANHRLGPIFGQAAPL